MTARLRPREAWIWWWGRLAIKRKYGHINKQMSSIKQPGNWVQTPCWPLNTGTDTTLEALVNDWTLPIWVGLHRAPPVSRDNFSAFRLQLCKVRTFGTREHSSIARIIWGWSTNCSTPKSHAHASSLFLVRLGLTVFRVKLYPSINIHIEWS